MHKIYSIFYELLHRKKLLWVFEILSKFRIRHIFSGLQHFLMAWRCATRSIRRKCLHFGFTNSKTKRQAYSRSFLSQPNMRFVQFARKNDLRKRLGVVSQDGLKLVELSGGSCVSHDMLGFIRQNISMQEIERKVNNIQEESITDSIKILPPLSKPDKIICIGLNYKDHCKEQNKPVPKEPIFFSKYPNTLIGARDDIIAHAITNKIDWEIELAVIIGKEAKNVSRENAMDYVFGYSIAQDISARDWQKERNGGQFLIGKSMDTFCPIGPTIVHKSLIADINDLNMKTYVNGVEKQNGNTKNMIFKIDDIISRITQCITLEPGDIILTGTPKGVGMHRDPPEFLKPGDVVRSEIDCIGHLCNKVVLPRETNKPSSPRTSPPPSPTLAEKIADRTKKLILSNKATKETFVTSESNTILSRTSHSTMQKKQASEAKAAFHTEE